MLRTVATVYSFTRISASELQNVLTWINKDITVAEIGQILREVDTNNDGTLMKIQHPCASSCSDILKVLYSRVCLCVRMHIYIYIHIHNAYSDCQSHVPEHVLLQHT